MSQNEEISHKEPPPEETRLEAGAYEIIRKRLLSHGDVLKARLNELNAARKDTFGSIDLTLIGSERITTDNNCEPRDMIPVGSSFLFGYNVQFGLRSEINIEDVLGVYEHTEQGFRQSTLDLIENERFREDFKNLYKYYKDTRFAKFSLRGPHLFMIFQVGKKSHDIKTFKWLITKEGKLQYIDNRSDHEYKYPPQHEFEWRKTTRDDHRMGQFPHVSIEDKIFVEAVGGDLTIKIEDNTETGGGVYAESVEEQDQTLDDALIYYANLGNLILLKIKPYQEKNFRHIVFSRKVNQAKRIDAIENSCVLLPEGHGIIFSNGYYLQNGEYKEFESRLEGMLFEKRISAPNGEDILYVFYNPDRAVYGLLPYNLIEQKIETPIICTGFSLFSNGSLVYFKAPDQPQKHHIIQIWRTPWVGPDHVADENRESYLYKIGNRDIVRCMAASNSLLALIRREDSYEGLYVDIVRQATDLLDAFFWIGDARAMNLREPVEEIRIAASTAIDEFDKVLGMRRESRKRVDEADKTTTEIMSFINRGKFETIEEFVRALADLRTIRGRIISLKALRYVDIRQVEQLETLIDENTAKLSHRCVDFLLSPRALSPYESKVVDGRGRIDKATTVAQAREIQKSAAECAQELEMLIEIVSNLRIEDANHRTAIIENISVIYSSLNQARSVLQNKIRNLASKEGIAEFASQMKLLNQAVIHYLDVSDSPEKCEEYLSKLMIQAEEIEGRFSDFDDFIAQILEKREEIYNAFETRKLGLVESRNKRASSLLKSAERVLKGIGTRIAGFKETSEINGYFASDLMMDKIRDIIRELIQIGDTVKADDVQSRVKALHEDAIRQLNDKKELFIDGGDLIRLGNHRFSVNTQPLDLTVVPVDGVMNLHLAGTNFFEPITDPGFLETRDIWDQEVVSENKQVYRGEYLAYRIYTTACETENGLSVESLAALDPPGLLRAVQQFMGPRFTEGYIKGVHDVDASAILNALLKMDTTIGLLRFHTRARAMGEIFWRLFCDPEKKRTLSAKLVSFGTANKYFKTDGSQKQYILELQEQTRRLAEESGLFDPRFSDEAGEYLFNSLSHGGAPPIAQQAARIFQGFFAYLQKHRGEQDFSSLLRDINGDPTVTLNVLRDWLGAFLSTGGDGLNPEYGDEAAALILCETFNSTRVSPAVSARLLEGLVGSHPAIHNGAYHFDFNEFNLKMRRYCAQDAPRFEKMSACKKTIAKKAADEMRLHEFKPRVLTSFVRNKLIDTVYLPLIGDNLAKQLGASGDAKRVDRMGLLLVISPPGYGKTTLMEYVAHRLGITFVKINGPSIGDRVTSLDPDEAPNAAARSEIEKLNLSFEMGDNVMIYLDDIQHCHPEFLQKFISLCDATRKIEGTYKGRTRTYDMRGRKVAIVMAGNPYTESGEKFKIPDMLSNRADTYNLGDILGDYDDVFKLSYLENAMTSNPVLAKLAARSPKDVHAFIQMAETGLQEGVDFEASYTPSEVSEFINVIKKLIRARDIILKVNKEYIRSAGQEDQYRNEPPFKLQGSYRNMNRIAQRIVPIMNEEELETLIYADYENEAQTLTTGAESNLLKLKEISGRLSPEEGRRWEEIKKTFKRNLLYGAVDRDDPAGQVVMQLRTFSDGLESIKSAVETSVARILNAQESAQTKSLAATRELAEMQTEQSLKMYAFQKAKHEDKSPARIEAALSKETLDQMGKIIKAFRPQPAPGIKDEPKAPPPDTFKMTLSGEMMDELKKVVRELTLTIQAVADRPPAFGEAGYASTETGSVPIDAPAGMYPRNVYSIYQLPPNYAPPATQGKLFMQALAFDKNLKKRCDKAVVIGVLYMPGNPESDEAKNLMMTIFNKSFAQKTVQDLPVHAVEIPFNSQVSFKAAARRLKINTLYMCPGFERLLTPILESCASSKILSMTGIELYVKAGACIAAVLDQGTPNLFINRAGVEKIGADFDERLLNRAILM